MKSHSFALQWTAIAIALVVAIGCGKNPTRGAKVTGTVLVDGQLAERGTITFHPIEHGPLAVGRIMSDGSFAVRTGQGDLSNVDGGTLAPGEYQVTIVVTGESTESIGEGGPPKAGPRLTAAKYASVETTDQQVTVNEGDNLFEFKLDGAAADEPASDSEPADASASDAPESNAAEAETADAPAAGDNPKPSPSDESSQEPQS